jgi:predicted amidohydrolase
MTSSEDLAANVRTIVDYYRQATERGAQLVAFPENSLFFRIRSGQPLQAPEWGGIEFQKLAGAVNERRAPLLLTTALREKSGKFLNSTILFKPHSEPRVVYSKIHLFDVDVPGAPPVRESEVFAAGSEPAMIEVDGWKIGLTICYDLRFAELFLKYAQKADVILVPSAFLVPTGQAHWEVLLRARAIEAQAYVAAPAQAGDHVSGDQRRQTYGHSMAIDPWGEVLCDLKDAPAVAVVELARSRLEDVRKRIPMVAHRRLL